MKRNPLKEPIAITAKYAGRCRACGATITIGDYIWFGGKGKVWHRNCYNPKNNISLPDPVLERKPDTTQPEPHEYSEHTLRGMKIKDLRHLCKDKSIGVPGWNWYARKHELIDGLMGRQIVSKGGAPSSNGQLTREDITGMIDDAFKVWAGTPADESMVRRIAGELLASTREIDVNLPGKKTKKIAAQHKTFETLLLMVATKTPVYMVGPAGSGKTHAAEQVAKALGLDYYCESVCIQTPASKLVGYMDATGNYVQTVFRQAYEHGGIFLLDEMDNGNANVLAILNAALANGQASFPDGMVKRHKDFFCIAAANTYGYGADRQYVGRCQLDAATLDRFITLEWDYDEALERKIACNDEWTDYVQAARKAASTLGIRVVISPRASVHGGRLLEAGMPREAVEHAVLYKALDKQSVQKIKAHALTNGGA